MLRTCIRTITSPTSRFCPSAGAHGAFQRCCGASSPASVSPPPAHLLLNRGSLHRRTAIPKMCHKTERRVPKPEPFYSRRVLTHLVSSLSEFGAGSPRRTKWVFALGRPSPRLSQLPLFASVGARIQSFPKSLTTGPGNAAFSEPAWQLTKALI